MDIEPYAYWNGNPFIADTRKDLLKNAMSQRHRTGMLAYSSRYKIYIEGYAWFVNEKYILSYDLVTLLVKLKYYDFFTRGLQPLHHYRAIRHESKCRSIKFAVDWGNNHKQKRCGQQCDPPSIAPEVYTLRFLLLTDFGTGTSNFIHEELKMDYVYDYMFHLLNEYAKLLRFEPRIPKGAAHLCSESMACPADESPQKSMTESLVKSPSATDPCTVPPPYEP